MNIIFMRISNFYYLLFPTAIIFLLQALLLAGMQYYSCLLSDKIDLAWVLEKSIPSFKQYKQFEKTEPAL